MQVPDFLLHAENALRHVFHDTGARAVFVVASPVMFLIMFFLPIETIPGNDLAFQLLFFGVGDYLVIGAFSFLGALVVAMHTAIVRQGLLGARSVSVAGSVGVLSAIFSIFFATSACVLCAGALFGFIGFGATLFLSDARWYFVGASGALLIFSLFLSAERLGGGCDACRADARVSS